MRRNITPSIIIETAVDIADTQGLDQVNLTAIACRLDIKKQSLYNHIENLSQVKCDMVLYACAQLRTVLAEAAIGLSREQAILAIAQAYRKFSQEHPGQYQVIISDARKYKTDEKVKEAIRSSMQILRQVLCQYDLHDDDLTHAVRGLRSVLHGFASLEASGWFQCHIDKSESYLRLVQAYIYGIEAWEAQKRQGE